MDLIYTYFMYKSKQEKDLQTAAFLSAQNVVHGFSCNILLLLLRTLKPSAVYFRIF